MRTAEPSHAAVWLALAVVVMEVGVSANLLTDLGLPYVTDGGALPLKLHPGTDLLIAFTMIAIVTEPRAWLRRLEMPLAIYLGGILATILCAITFTGRENLIVLLDTFLPAGLMAALLLQLQEGAMTMLRRTLQAAFSVNAVLALGEVVLQKNLVPLYLNDAAYSPHAEDFRPTALYDHPLTGALMTMMALALAPSGARTRLAYAALMWASLVAFAGRMAIVMVLVGVALTRGSQALRLIVSRDPQAGQSILLAAGVLLVAAFGLILSISLGLADRLSGHLYWDASTQVRLAQWGILAYLDTWQLIFGMTRQSLLEALNALRLATGAGVIENFWLLMFVTLGISGFSVFLVAMGGLGVWCWREYDRAGRYLLVSVMIVASTSNSLGRKSTVLVCLVISLACLPRKSASATRTVTERLASGVAQPA